MDGEFFPYIPNEVLQNPLCLRTSPLSPAAPSIKKLQPVLLWSPPSQSCVEWNVNASLNTSLQKSATGRVLRDHDGKLICIFSSPIPCVEINHAEVLAVHRAIKLLRRMNLYVLKGLLLNPTPQMR